MANKIKTITLETWERVDLNDTSIPKRMERLWRVMKVTDSVEFHPGQELCKPEVDTLVELKNWKVTVTAWKS